MSPKVGGLPFSKPPFTIYCLSLFHRSSKAASNIEKHFRSFLWNEKQDYGLGYVICRQKVSLPKSQGGFGLVDIKLKSKASSKCI